MRRLNQFSQDVEEHSSLTNVTSTFDDNSVHIYDDSILKTDILAQQKNVNCDSEVNILVLGETGVGKSTWINGITNYFKFNDFKTAIVENDPICLIPMSFNMYSDKTLKKIPIVMPKTIGSNDTNEAEASSHGQSSTQKPKVYSYIMDNIKFNLIDTPGIGDTRGIEADTSNIKMIFKTLSKWNKIHGICLLLKPNESRLKISLRYCIEELLVNLHKNAIPNIVVVFTNACNTLFKPGDTMTVLTQLFENVGKANQNFIHLNSSNTYCIDNEAVRMLYASFKGIMFEEKDIEIISKSWNHTAKEIRRLFSYISTLAPHSVEESKVTYKKRLELIDLCINMADLQDKMTYMEKVMANQKTFKATLTSSSNGSNKIYVQIIKKTLAKKPSTVCCGKNCTEAIWNPNTDEIEIFYGKICCSSCPLKDVPIETSGTPKLRTCNAFQYYGTCNNCKC
jgi:predicted GTPase